MSCGGGRGPAASPERGRSPPSGRRAAEDADGASSPMRGRMGTQGSPVKSYDYLLKFLLVGDSDVGKGEILESLQDGASESPYAYSNGEGALGRAGGREGGAALLFFVYFFILLSTGGAARFIGGRAAGGGQAAAVPENRKDLRENLAGAAAEGSVSEVTPGCPDPAAQLDVPERSSASTPPAPRADPAALPWPPQALTPGPSCARSCARRSGSVTKEQNGSGIARPELLLLGSWLPPAQLGRSASCKHQGF